MGDYWFWCEEQTATKWRPSDPYFKILMGQSFLGKIQMTTFKESLFNFYDHSKMEGYTEKGDVSIESKGNKETVKAFHGQYKKCEGTGNGNGSGAAQAVCCESRGAICCASVWQSKGDGGAKSERCPQHVPFLKSWIEDEHQHLGRMHGFQGLAFV